MSDVLQPLRDWLTAHPDASEAVAEVRGGDVTTDADGTRRITMPWARYNNTIPDFWAALKGVPGWNHQATNDYSAVVDRWLKQERVRHLASDQFARMDRSTLLNVLRWINRGEKFCDRHWQGCFKQGLFHAAARALIALGPGDPPSAEPSNAAGRRQGELF